MTPTVAEDGDSRSVAPGAVVVIDLRTGRASAGSAAIRAGCAGLSPPVGALPPDGADRSLTAPSTVIRVRAVMT